MTIRAAADPPAACFRRHPHPPLPIAWHHECPSALARSGKAIARVRRNDGSMSSSGSAPEKSIDAMRLKRAYATPAVRSRSKNPAPKPGHAGTVQMRREKPATRSPEHCSAPGENQAPPDRRGAARDDAMSVSCPPRRSPAVIVNFDSCLSMHQIAEHRPYTAAARSSAPGAPISRKRHLQAGPCQNPGAQRQPAGKCGAGILPASGATSVRMHAGRPANSVRHARSQGCRRRPA